MKPRRSIRLEHSAKILVGSIVTLLASHSAQAVVRTWTGTTSTDWAALNGFSAIPVTGDSLVFGAEGAAGSGASDVLTNTLTSTAFNIAGITFNAGAPAYTMNGNSFNLTAGMTNNSGVLQTFNNTGVVPVSGSTGGTVSSATGLTLNGGTTWNVGTGGVNVSGLQFNTTNNSSSTTTVNGTGGTLTIGYLALSPMSNSRLIQTFNGTGNISVGTMVSGGSASLASSSFVYSGTGTFSLTGSHSDTFGDTISSGTFNLSGTLGAKLDVTGTGIFTETATGVMSGANALTLSSTGTSTLSGANTYTGATTVNAGNLVLDHSVSGAPTTNIINNTANSSAVVLGGGTLSITGNVGAPNSDRFNGTTFSANTSSRIIFTQNGATSLGATLGGLTRGAQSTLDVTLPTTGTVSTSSTTFATNGVLTSAATNGIAFATVNGGAAFASNTAGTLGAITPVAGTYGAAANVSVGAADAPASGLGANTLTFGGAAGSVAFTGTNAITTGGILLTPSATGTSTISGGTITAGGGKELVISNYEPTGSGSLMISSIIADNTTASALTIAGTGTTVLSAANTFTGQTMLLGGSLRLANQLALQNSILTQATGSSLVFDSAGGTAFTLGGLNGGPNILLQNSAAVAIALTVGGNNYTSSYSGVLSGTGGSLTKTGTGTFTLSNVNTYTGATLISGGVLELTSSAAIANTSSVSVGSNAFLRLDRNANQSTVLGTAVISGAGGIIENINNPNQAPSLDRANTYTGPTQLGIRGGFTAGVASTYDGSGNQLTGAFGVNSAIQMTAGGPILYLAGRNNQVGSLSGNSGNVYLGSSAGNPAAILTIGGDNSSTSFGVTISDTWLGNNSSGSSAVSVGGQIVKIGSGTQTFTGNNLYGGATTITGGILSITTIANGGAQTTGSTSGSSTTLTVASTAGIVAGQSVYGAGTQGGTTVTAVGVGSVTLSGAVTVPASSGLSFGSGNGIGTSSNAASNLVLDGGTLQYLGTTVGSTDRLFQIGQSTDTGAATGTIDSSSVSSVNTLSFTNTGALTYGKVDQADNLTLTGSNTGANALAPSIGNNGSGAVSVTKTGAGTWALTGANTYSGGTTLNAGTLTSAVTGGFGAGAVTVAPTGTLLAASATLNSTGSIAATALVTVNNNSAAIGTVNFNGTVPTIGGLSGTGNVVLNNSGGTALTVGSTNNLTSSFAGVISNGAGMGSLVKAGTGTLTLSNNSTYTGATSVSAGTLLVNGALGNTASTTVSAAAVLGGTGAIANSATVAGTITGNAQGSIGTLTTGALNLQSGSTYAYDIATGTLDGDALRVNGGLTLDSGATLQFTLANAGALSMGSKLTLIAYSGIWNNGIFNGYSNNSTFNIAGDSNVWQINYADTSGGSNLNGLGGSYTTITAVPETSAALLGALGGLILLRRRRRD